MSAKNIALLSNPTLENIKSSHVAALISILLEREGVTFTSFSNEWPEEWTGFTEVWIIGGDGTVNWFINHNPDFQLPIAVFAGGSGNDFHWMLFGDITVEEQVMKILGAVPVKLDAGKCNGRLFLNGVGIGFDGIIVKDLAGKKKKGGKAAYLLSIMKHVVSYNEKPCTIRTDDQIIEQDCFMISIANGRRYGGGFKVAPLAELNDGLLDLSIIGTISPLKRIKYLPVMEKGEHLDLPFIRYMNVERVKISSPEFLNAHLDGEYHYANDFDIEIVPGRFSFLF